MKFNYTLFDQVVEGFRLNPDRLVMSLPVRKHDGGSADKDNYNHLDQSPRCGTVGCFCRLDGSV